MNIQIIEHHCVEIHSDAKLESIYVIYNFWYMIFITSNSYIYYYIRKKGYLVDPASSDMLVSKIKPCKSKYKSFLLMKLRTAH